MYELYNGKNFFVLMQDSVHAYSGGIDDTLKMYDFNASAGMYIFLTIG